MKWDRLSTVPIVKLTDWFDFETDERISNTREAQPSDERLHKMLRWISEWFEYAIWTPYPEPLSFPLKERNQKCSASDDPVYASEMC